MTDKQQIEKFATDLCKACSLKNCKSEYPPCVKAQWVSEALYNAGYRKIPENAVVLTREEYEWLKDKAKELNDIYSNGFRTLAEVDELIKQERKATAKDFIFKVESYLGYNDDNETFTKKELLLILAEVAKEQFGVEVDE